MTMYNLTLDNSYLRYSRFEQYNLDKFNQDLDIIACYDIDTNSIRAYSSYCEFKIRLEKDNLLIINSFLTECLSYEYSLLHEIN